MGHYASEMMPDRPPIAEHETYAEGRHHCRLCHHAWPCPDVSGVAELRVRVAELEAIVAQLSDGTSDAS